MITRDQLYIADELFLCGTAAEVVAVREIDTRVVGNGAKGPVTAALEDAFQKNSRGKGPHSAEWLDMVGVGDRVNEGGNGKQRTKGKM
jgi:branched-chain amino acid aminotransferase